MRLQIELIATCLLGSVLLAGPGSIVGPAAPEKLAVPSLVLPGAETANTSPTTLVIDPTDWWLVPGNSSPFDANWVGIPPGCTLSPQWYRWSTVGNSVEGTVSPTDAQSVNFTAISSVTGTSAVQVQSAAVLTCGARSSALFRSAEARVTVDAPLSFAAAYLGPNPAAPNQTVTLYSGLVGGSPPYLVRIGWGDGSVTWTNVTAPGPFEVAHLYSVGQYDPVLWASDSAGLAANLSAEEEVTVSNTLAVGIVPSSYIAEVGVSTTFRAIILHPPTAFSWSGYCAGASGERSDDASESPMFNCTFVQSGIDRVWFGVWGAGSDLGNASAVLPERVAAPLAARVSAPDVPSEVGNASDVLVEVSGGVPPFSVRWYLVGNRSSGTDRLFADGSLLLPVWPSGPGMDDVAVTVVDALGVIASNATVALDVAPSLAAEATSGGGPTVNATALVVSSSVVSGDPPFVWVVVPEYAPIGESPPTGVLLTATSFTWNATFDREGTINLTVAIVDSTGAFWQSNLSEQPVASLELSAGVGAGPPGVIEVNLTVTGGVPPFFGWVNTSAGTVWNNTLSGDGSATREIPVSAAGNVSVTVSLVDRLGEWARADGVADVRPPSVLAPSAPVPPDEGLAVGFALLGFGVVCAAGFVAWRRRRQHAAPPPAPDAREVLRRIIEPADGVDRSTVELLAEEAGVAFEVAQLTLDRLIVDGTVRSEAGPVGDEILAWARPGVP